MKFAAAAIIALAFSHTACAKTLSFSTTLLPSNEVPATTSSGTGKATATLDTDTGKLTYDVTFQGFESPVTMAHFHGPAPVGANAGVQVPLGAKPTSPIKGSTTLTAAQQKQLEDGLWYVNVHSAKFPKGAIRGQLVAEK